MRHTQGKFWCNILSVCLYVRERKGGGRSPDRHSPTHELTRRPRSPFRLLHPECPTITTTPSSPRTARGVPRRSLGWDGLRRPRCRFHRDCGGDNMIVSPTNLVVFLESSSTPETFAIVIALVTSRVNFHAELHTFSYALNLGPNWETKTLTRLSNSRLSLPNSRLSLLPHRTKDLYCPNQRILRSTGTASTKQGLTRR